jgi:PKD repeat protein
MINYKLLLGIFVIAMVFSSGCLTRPELPYGFEVVDDVLVSSLEEVERRVPPPEFVKSFLETTTIGTGEDKDIFDFEDCDWDVQKYYSLGSYNTRSNKGWFINMEVLSYLPEGGYLITSPSYLYVGHGNHKLYDVLHGMQGYYTPSCLRVSQFSGTGGQSGGMSPNYTASGTARVNSPLFVMKENYVTAYMYYDRWMTGYVWNTTCGTPHSLINVKVQLIDATSGGVISEQIFERSWEEYTICSAGCSVPNMACDCYAGNYRIKTDNLSNMEGMWRPVILNGSTYKGRTVFLRIDTTLNSGQQWGNTCAGNGESFDVYFDEIHFSDEYGDYITYYTSVPPVPNYSYTISDKTVAVNGTSSTDNGTITEYRWSWGDGTQSFGAIDTHQYSADNNYTVQLCVTDDEQMTVCIQKIINVKTTPTTNTVVTGTTTPDNSTTTVVTPPVTTPVTTTPTTTTTTGSTTTSTTSSTTNTTNPFPWWGLFVTLAFIVLLIGGAVILFGKKGKKRILNFRTPKRKVKQK